MEIRTDEHFKLYSSFATKTAIVVTSQNSCLAVMNDFKNLFFYFYVLNLNGKYLMKYTIILYFFLELFSLSIYCILRIGNTILFSSSVINPIEKHSLTILHFYNKSLQDFCFVIEVRIYFSWFGSQYSRSRLTKRLFSCCDNQLNSLDKSKVIAATNRTDYGKNYGLKESATFNQSRLKSQLSTPHVFLAEMLYN